MPPSEILLDVNDVVKTYAAIRAVDHITMNIQRGEIFAMLGPNGAGKTTLVRMILGMSRPDGGTITYYPEGPNVKPDPSRLGYLPEDRGLYKDLPIIRTLAYFGTLRGMTHAQAMNAAGIWLERLELADRGKDKLDALSKGNQQKVQFAAAVLHKPAFAILDEPFSGLDPLNQELFLKLIAGLRDEGMTILLSAHQMSLVERLADRVLLMSKGRRILYGALDDIRREVGAGHRVTFRISGVRDPRIAEDLARRLPLIQNDDHITLTVPHDTPIAEILQMGLDAWNLTHVHTDRMSLHDLYLQALGPQADADDLSDDSAETENTTNLHTIGAIAPGGVS